MLRRCVLGVLSVAASAGLCGCWSVAATVAGGAMLATGAYVLDDSAEQVLPIPMAEAESVVRGSLAQLDILIAEAKPSYSNGAVSRWVFYAAAVGDEVVPVDVTLSQVSQEMTRVTVKVRGSDLMPDMEMASTVVARIRAEARERALAPRTAPRGTLPGG